MKVSMEPANTAKREIDGNTTRLRMALAASLRYLRRSWFVSPSTGMKYDDDERLALLRLQGTIFGQFLRPNLKIVLRPSP